MLKNQLFLHLMMTNVPDTIDDYIADFPEEIQKRLEMIRQAIQKAAPGATEAMKYAMPTFVLHGNLVHFAAFKNHIGFYPAPAGIAIFQEELSKYKSGKGSVQFPLDQPLPIELITRIVEFRVQQQLEKAGKKK